MTSVASGEIPTSRLDFRNKGYQPYWMLVTAYRSGSNEPVTIEMDFGEWLAFAPVQYVVKLELSQKQPRRPAPNKDRPETVPHGHIEWRDGQNWVVVTAHRTGTQEAVTIEMTLWQWFGLKMVRFAVEQHLTNWHDRKMPRW